MPVSAALYISVIAQLTGWSEHHIRWHLPLSRGWSYFHAARALAGESRVWIKPTKQDLQWESRVTAFIGRHCGNVPDQATAK